MPDFVAPQLCTLVERPPGSEDWCHEIKFDGYRVQMRVEGGEVELKTRKGLDWTDKFGAIAKAGSALPDALIDGEIVALDHNGSRIFRRCRLRFPTAKPKTSFSSPSICCSPMERIFARCRWASARSG